MTFKKYPRSVAPAALIAAILVGCEQQKAEAVCAAPETLAGLSHILAAEAIGRLKRTPLLGDDASAIKAADLEKLITVSNPLFEGVDGATGRITCSGDFRITFPKAEPETVNITGGLLRRLSGLEPPTATDTSGAAEHATYSRQKVVTGDGFYYQIATADHLIGAAVLAAVLMGGETNTSGSSSSAQLSSAQIQDAQSKLTEARRLCHLPDDADLADEARWQPVIDDFEELRKLSPALLTKDDERCLAQASSTMEARRSRDETLEAEGEARSNAETRVPDRPANAQTN